MTTEEHIIELSRKLDRWHEEDLKRDTRNKYENLCYICWGFALAVTSLAVTNPHLVNGIMAGGFFIVSITLLIYSRKFKAT